MRIIGMTILLGTLLLASAASAQGLSLATICFRWQPDFTDLTGGDDLTTNDSIPAYGVRATISAGRVTWFDGYTSSATGCVTLGLAAGWQYEVLMWAEAEVATGQIVRYASSGNRTRQLVVDSNLSPVRGNASATYTWAPGLGAEASSVMSAAAHTVRNARGTGVGPGTWELVSLKCPSGTSVACYSDINDTPNLGKVYIGGSARTSRFVVAHELGHHVNNIYGTKIPDVDYSMNSGPYGRCPSNTGGHTAESLEHQSAAANEGFANFVSAIAFNDETETDCTEFGVDCEGIWFPDRQLEFNAHRYAERYCMGSMLGAFVPMPGTGNESDWLRTFWDLTTDQNVPYTRIYELMASLHGNRAGTYWAARDRAAQMGITSFRSVAASNGIDW